MPRLDVSSLRRLSYLIEEGVSSHVEDVNFDFSVSDLDPEIFKWKQSHISRGFLHPPPNSR